MSLKVLAVGDMHLGRTPSGLPESLSVAELGPAQALEASITLAIEAGVQAVLFAGDLVEHEQDFFEARRLLKPALERLIAADIVVLAVCGNHDASVLPSLADELEGLQLLGRHQTWQAHTIEYGGERLTVHGWSFDRRHIQHSPLAHSQPQRQAGVNLGLLHCDLDQSQSSYAPVSRQALQAQGLDGWVLGHVHAADALSVEDPIGYLGSLTSLHRNDLGARGPWLIEVAAGRLQAITHLPLTPVMWQVLELDVSAVDEVGQLRPHLDQAVQQFERALSDWHQSPRVVTLHLTLSGQSALGRVLETELLAWREAAQNLSASQTTQVFIDRVRVATVPVRDLAELARRPDHVGLLAQRLQALEAMDSDQAQALLNAARETVAPLHAPQPWHLDAEVDAEAMSDAALLAVLIEAGRRSLEALLTQDAGSS